MSKRVLCAAALAVAAFAATPAHAAYDPGIKVTPVVNEHTIGVGVHGFGQPVGGAYVNRDTGEICVGLSYQIPFCAGGPIN
jgi:opacity protein-like surface antigen